MENIDNKNQDQQKENTPVFSKNEQKEKAVLEFAYIKDQIENSFGNATEKQKKNIFKLLKSFEKDLEDLLEIKISVRDKSTYLQLKNSNFDSNALKLSKYIQ
ncbi:hypothetical protein NZD88_20695 [Chryseobacterium antibioticum]|uniref:Uncharacterized protein n=1 Tax=Chryseobacterium pyrolae TaxID=2987481 RepID=A0ABT2IMY0_9FLAO|nr:hypothetical protein [Chryseobacterium pyrolae]MCT2409981.1 hypothetical protein [Chryseobacterium pyrolae]